MALQLDTIRATADRIAASHQLDIVDLEFSGGAKFRTLRIFIEKNAEARAKLAAEAAAAEQSELPKNVPTEILSFTTHEDCEVFTRDFGTVLDVEDLIPGAEYTLEVSSPGLERKLSKPADFTRFTGSLVKIQTFSAVNANRHFQGRLIAFHAETQALTLDLTAIKQKGKPKKVAGAKAAPNQSVEIAFSNIEKANLIPEL
jgi:ribosome maturation factor RimP